MTINYLKMFKLTLKRSRYEPVEPARTVVINDNKIICFKTTDISYGFSAKWKKFEGDNEVVGYIKMNETKAGINRMPPYGHSYPDYRVDPEKTPHRLLEKEFGIALVQDIDYSSFTTAPQIGYRMILLREKRQFIQSQEISSIDDKFELKDKISERRGPYYL